MHRLCYYGVLAAILLFAGNGYCTDTTKAPERLLNYPLNTGKMAFESALEFLGQRNIVRLDSATYTAVPTVISDTTATFTRDVISGRPVWKIVIPHVAIMAGMDSSNVKLGSVVDVTFEVLLDSLNGYCLLMRAINLSKLKYEPSKHDTTLPFNFKDIEYHGLPDHYPSIGFCELLGDRSVLTRSAHEIIGIYVKGINRDINFKDYNEYPIWIMTVNGLPPFESGTTFIYSNMRMVFNDRTGQGLLQCFVGRPVVPDSSLNPSPE